MSTEHREGQTPFRTVVKPLVEGANPYNEEKFGAARSTNPRAVFVQRTFLYEGTQRQVTLGDGSMTARGFMEIRQSYFPDGEILSLPFLHWGLKDSLTDEVISGYNRAEFEVDPIWAFRTVRVLENLPSLNTEFDQQTEDLSAALGASTEAYFVWELQTDKYIDRLLERKGRMANLIGNDIIHNILGELPPFFQEMLNEMRERGVRVVTENLERELRLKRLAPSEFYLDFIAAHSQDVADLMKGLEETGGVW